MCARSSLSMLRIMLPYLTVYFIYIEQKPVCVRESVISVKCAGLFLSFTILVQHLNQLKMMFQCN